MRGIWRAVVLMGHVAVMAAVGPLGAQAQAPDDLDAMNRQVVQLYQPGKYVEATDIAKRSLCGEEFGSDHPSVATRATVAGMERAPTIPTLEQLRRSTPWCWVVCERCLHRQPIAFVPLIIRLGPDASSDLLRRSARCSKCLLNFARWPHANACRDRGGQMLRKRTGCGVRGTHYAPHVTTKKTSPSLSVAIFSDPI